MQLLCTVLSNYHHLMICNLILMNIYNYLNIFQSHNCCMIGDLRVEVELDDFLALVVEDNRGGVNHEGLVAVEVVDKVHDLVVVEVEDRDNVDMGDMDMDQESEVMVVVVQLEFYLYFCLLPIRWSFWEKVQVEGKCHSY